MSPRKGTPDQESSEVNPELASETTVAEAPDAEGPQDDTKLAERFGKRKWTPRPDPYRQATDNVARVTLFESKRDRQMAIMFGDGLREDKPSQAVLDTVRAAGYRWDSSDRIWAHPVHPENANSTRFAAERLYKEVCSMIRHEKGLDAGQELPF